MAGYKLFREDGSSLSDAYGSVQYALDGTPTVVPSRGAFVAHSVAGLLRGTFGPLLGEADAEAAAEAAAWAVVPAAEAMASKEKARAEAHERILGYLRSEVGWI